MAVVSVCQAHSGFAGAGGRDLRPQADRSVSPPCHPGPMGGIQRGCREQSRGGADVRGGGGTGVELGAPGENVERFFRRTIRGSGKTNTNHD